MVSLPCSLHQSESDRWRKLKARSLFAYANSSSASTERPCSITCLSTLFGGKFWASLAGRAQGKSVLMRAILGLAPVREGSIEVFGLDLAKASESERRATERRWGILFQQGALFSSLSVRQNVQFPMREYLDLSDRLLNEVAMAKLEMVGLTPDVADKFPAELSGGMIKRVALARALALDPEIVFLDEPTSGLDPIGANAFDDLILTLQRTLGLTVFMVTHDLDSLHRVSEIQLRFLRPDG